jgi:D-alanyl-D-alanine carboxypeptidase/D-alanyl-D-alanine-endopeptidase (penicillin-binding protein 4)
MIPVMPWYRKIVFSLLIILCSCGSTRELQKLAKRTVIDASVLKTAHIGILLMDPASGKTLYGFNSEKYFIPASNTKIPTCYAALKYLGDSLAAFRFWEDSDELVLEGTGDPTLLHPDYSNAKSFDQLRQLIGRRKVSLATGNWKDRALGSGWSWNDYNEYYMAERSPFPLYGNIVTFVNSSKDISATPRYFNSAITNTDIKGLSSVERILAGNVFRVNAAEARFKSVEVPFFTDGYETARELLSDTLKTSIRVRDKMAKEPASKNTIFSQPLDSVLKPMMYRSDNFFAEQLLLMVSNERLGFMNDAAIIDTLLKSDFRDLPQKPRWVDGSGLSRYNLFTPHDLVVILKKIKDEFGMERIQKIFATGGQGTISNYYKIDSGFIYGKTGTLSGVVAFSGFMFTKSGRLIIFSTLVNNHQSSATEIRRVIEKFLQNVRNRM